MRVFKAAAFISAVLDTTQRVRPEFVTEECWRTVVIACARPLFVAVAFTSAAFVTAARASPVFVTVTTTSAVRDTAQRM